MIIRGFPLIFRDPLYHYNELSYNELSVPMRLRASALKKHEIKRPQSQMDWFLF